MSTFQITIHATAIRNIGQLNGAEELIRSVFYAKGMDALEASEGMVEKFKGHYVSLDDLQITFIGVVPGDGDPDDTIHVEFPIHLKEQAS